MDLDRFEKLTGTPGDDRKIVTLMVDPQMTDDTGQEVGFLSLVDRGANGRRFRVWKAEGDGPGTSLEPTTAPGSDVHPQAWLGRFLGALGLGGLVAKLGIASKGEDDPITFDAAMLREQLRRARWQATDALWEVIANILANDQVTDKAGAVKLALEQFSSTVLGLVTATLATKAEARAEVLEGLEPGPDDLATLATKAGRKISARNRATLVSSRDALAKAVAALEDLIKIDEPPTDETATKAEGEEMDATQIKALATEAGANAITAAKAAGITDAGQLAQIGAEASTAVFKAAVMGPAQAAMPTNTLANQMAQSGPNASASDPLAQINEVLSQVRGLATKIDAIDKAVNGHGEGDEREPGALELAAKAAELSAATASKVAKIETTPAAPRGGGDPAPATARKADTDDTWSGSALAFTSPAKG